MPITLTTPVSLANGTRVGIFHPGTEDEAGARWVIPVDLRTPVATNQIVARHFVEVRNGMSDRVVRGAPGAGEMQQGYLVLQRNALSTPTGYDQLAAAVDAQVTKSGKRAAAESVLVSLGVIDPATLGGI